MEEQLLLFTAQGPQDPREEAVNRILAHHFAGHWRDKIRLVRFWRQGKPIEDKTDYMRDKFGFGESVNEFEHFCGNLKGFSVFRTCTQSPELSFAETLTWEEVARRFDEIVPAWEPFDCSEEAELREGIRKHIQWWGDVGWGGPTVGGRCSVNSMDVKKVNGESVYAYLRGCRLIEQEDAEHWIAEVVDEIGTLKGERLRLHILDIWVPMTSWKDRRKA